MNAFTHIILTKVYKQPNMLIHQFLVCLSLFIKNRF